MKVVDFELILSPADSHYTAVVRCTITEPSHQETVIDTAGKPPMRVVIDQNLLQALALDTYKYGLTLGQMLLADPQLAKLVAQARTTSQQAQVPLRLRLNLPPDLQPLRWETLRDPHEPDTPLLMTGEQVAGSRYLSSTDWRPVGPRLFGARRALVLLASPPNLKDYNLEPLAMGDQHELIRQTFKGMPITVLDTGQARLDRLIAELRSGPDGEEVRSSPDILLILAHGRVDDDGETWLYLEGKDGHTDPVSGNELAERIAELNVRPQLIILGVCESAGNGYGAALLALGPKLAQIGVPAVLAMQARITVETLRGFLPACLRELEREGRVDQAVAVARGAVRERPDFWVPVLFQRLASGRLWQMPGAEPETSQELLERMPTDRVPEDCPSLAPISRMDFAPNPQFVGRTPELCQFAAQLKAGKTVAVTSRSNGAGNPAVIMTGIGGVGKTQLAIELAHRYGGYFAGGVFWLSFADPVSIAGEVAACGLRGLVTRPDYAALKQDEQVEVVRAAWQQPIPRLLIFDNCEDEALLQRWLPKTGGCRVLVTSRRASWSATFKVRTLRLDVLPRADSVALLQQLHADLTEAEAGKIAEVLGDLPLALHLAGCYLARYHTPADQYLDRLDTVRFIPHPSLQGRGVATMPTEREPNVEKVFALSFAQLDTSDSIDDLARQLLARAACFAPGEPFGRQWLEATITPEGDEEEQQLARTDALHRLLSLGLLELVGEDGVRLHRLLAVYAALAMSNTEALPAVEQVVARLASLASGMMVPQAMLPILAHLRHLVQQASGREDETTASLWNSLGVYLNIVGSYSEAQSLMERALALRERVQGSNHLDTALGLNNLAAMLKAQGAYVEARPLYERALAIVERVRGSDHPDTALSLNNLAGVLYTLGAYAEARLLYERALAIRERVLGANHPQMASSLNNLAALLYTLGAYVEARPLLERALAIQERVLGANHPQIASSLNNLAALLKAQGAYAEARPLYERALAIQERMLGSNHPQIASSLNNLAALLKAQGAYAEAHPLYERALAIQERTLGSNHPETASSLNKLAVLHAEQGQFAQALPLLERALSIRQARLGLTHPDTKLTQQSLVALRQHMAVADLPEAVRAALQAQDEAAFQQALQALPPEQAQAIVQRLQAGGILADPWEQLLQDIAAVALGNNTPHPQVEAALAHLEAQGYHLTAAVQAIWGGQRDPAVLTDGLDATDTALVQRILALLEPGDGARGV